MGALGLGVAAPHGVQAALGAVGLLGCGGQAQRKHQTGLREREHPGVFSANTALTPTAEPSGAGRGLPTSAGGDGDRLHCWSVRPAHPPLVALGGVFIPDFGQFAGQEAPVEGPFLRFPQVTAIVTRRLPRALTRLRGVHPLVRR